MGLSPPDGSDDWLGLTGDPLPLHVALEWAQLPSCGAVVLFSGAVRDHSEGRTGVTELHYEAYDEEVVPRFASIASRVRVRWPELGRLAMLHRTGELSVGEPAVVVVASAPHRDEAFSAARWCIDTLKSTVPIWKRERWEGGDDWAECSHQVEEVAG